MLGSCLREDRLYDIIPKDLSDLLRRTACGVRGDPALCGVALHSLWNGAVNPILATDVSDRG
jgi:hypothetical protein